MSSGSKEILAFVLSLIALTDLSIILDIPVLRQVLGFVFLTFLPGFLLIQIMRLTKHALEKTLFLIGLSISFLMFVPLLMNFIYPVLGISHPISVLPLTTTFSLILAGLSLIAYRNGVLDFQVTASHLKTLTDTIRTPPVLGAGLILVLGILGALFIRYDYDSILSLFSILSIVTVVILLVISRKVSVRFYPLYILVIALVLLYSRTLTSPNLFGRDIFSELYFADLVKANGIWDPSFAVSNAFLADYYSMLSVVFLPNVYSMLLNADTVWVYKLIIPFIFAFVPLALYNLYKTQIKFSDTSAFLAVFFFMSFSLFYWQIPRQQVATLFLVLAVLLIMSSSLGGSKKTALLLLFVASMVVSHYGTSYIFLFYFAVLLIGYPLIRAKTRPEKGMIAVSATLAVLFVAITFGWYMFSSGGAPYIALLDIGAHLVNTFGTELFTSDIGPSVAAGIGGGISESLFTHVLAHYWTLATTALITIGLGVVMWRRKAMLINAQFLLLSLASFFIGLIAIALPFVATVLNGSRLYAQMLLFLAPYCVIGIVAIVDMTSHRIRINKDRAVKLKHAALIVILIPYFLFNYGFIFEITEHTSNYAFLPSQNQSGRVVEYSHSADWSYLVQTPIPTESVLASAWLSSSRSGAQVYADSGATSELVGYGHILSVSLPRPWTVNESLHNAYLYLGPANVQNRSIALRGYLVDQEQPISSYPTLTAGNRVYSNGLAEVYYYP